MVWPPVEQGRTSPRFCAVHELGSEAHSVEALLADLPSVEANFIDPNAFVDGFGAHGARRHHARGSLQEVDLILLAVARAPLGRSRHRLGPYCI